MHRPGAICGTPYREFSNFSCLVFPWSARTPAGSPKILTRNFATDGLQWPPGTRFSATTQVEDLQSLEKMLIIVSTVRTFSTRCLRSLIGGIQLRGSLAKFSGLATSSCPYGKLCCLELRREAPRLSGRCRQHFRPFRNLAIVNNEWLVQVARVPWKRVRIS